MKKKKIKINVKNKTKEIVIEQIEKYLSNKEFPDTKSPLGIIFPKERIVHSIMQGLMTSFGTNGWEKLAEGLAIDNGFVVKDKNKFNENVPSLPDNIDKIVHDFDKNRLKVKNNISGLQELLREHLIKNNYTNLQNEKIPKGEGVDLWIEKNNIEYMYDFKTVQVNAGTGPKLSRNFCKWHAYRLLQDKNVKLITACVFPYDPHGGKFWEKEGGKISPLINGKDALLGDEFWSFITGQKKSINEIWSAFTEVRKSKILDKYSEKFYIKKKKNKN